MNCKKGDLAVVLYGAASGSFVRCIARYDGPWQQSLNTPGWIIEWQTPHPEYHNKVVDYALRPIRPQPDDAQDLLLAPVPSQKEPA